MGEYKPQLKELKLERSWNFRMVGLNKDEG